ncbi:MAG: hypothetical protein EZS28_001093 [Streblomastix strix]|uniref:Uncharacterized protein n=1 Tax=Streblomastix strix TaxID=222440 RepID=A0A5J4XA35_9EUKA|nr:MAG: hypothetical protein EZS28_001093 [Streblomastix strix]
MPISVKWKNKQKQEQLLQHAIEKIRIRVEKEKEFNRRLLMMKGGWQQQSESTLSSEETRKREEEEEKKKQDIELKLQQKKEQYEADNLKFAEEAAANARKPFNRSLSEAPKFPSRLPENTFLQQQHPQWRRFQPTKQESRALRRSQERDQRSKNVSAVVYNHILPTTRGYGDIISQQLQQARDKEEQQGMPPLSGRFEFKIDSKRKHLHHKRKEKQRWRKKSNEVENLDENENILSEDKRMQQVGFESKSEEQTDNQFEEDELNIEDKIKSQTQNMKNLPNPVITQVNSQFRVNTREIRTKKQPLIPYEDDQQDDSEQNMDQSSQQEFPTERMQIAIVTQPSKAQQTTNVYGGGSGGFHGFGGQFGKRDLNVRNVRNENKQNKDDGKIQSNLQNLTQQLGETQMIAETIADNRIDNIIYVYADQIVDVVSSNGLEFEIVDDEDDEDDVEEEEDDDAEEDEEILDLGDIRDDNTVVDGYEKIFTGSFEQIFEFDGESYLFFIVIDPSVVEERFIIDKSLSVLLPISSFNKNSSKILSSNQFLF